MCTSTTPSLLSLCLECFAHPEATSPPSCGLLFFLVYRDPHHRPRVRPPPRASSLARRGRAPQRRVGGGLQLPNHPPFRGPGERPPAEQRGSARPATTGHQARQPGHHRCPEVASLSWFGPTHWPSAVGSTLEMASWNLARRARVGADLEQQKAGRGAVRAPGAAARARRRGVSLSATAPSYPPRSVREGAAACWGSACPSARQPLPRRCVLGSGCAGRQRLEFFA